MKELFESSYLSAMSEENNRLRKEIERLNSIIKELRECIEDIKSKMIEQDKYYIDSDILLKILDKVSDKDE